MIIYGPGVNVINLGMQLICSFVNVWFINYACKFDIIGSKYFEMPLHRPFTLCTVCSDKVALATKCQMTSFDL